MPANKVRSSMRIKAHEYSRKKQTKYEKKKLYKRKQTQRTVARHIKKTTLSPKKRFKWK